MLVEAAVLDFQAVPEVADEELKVLRAEIQAPRLEHQIRVPEEDADIKTQDIICLLEPEVPDLLLSVGTTPKGGI